jgi:predicted O-methyltransferase YrrM
LERFKANIASYPNSEKVTAIQAEAIEGLSMLIAKGTPKFDFIYIDHLVELIFSFFCAPGRK